MQFEEKDLTVICNALTMYQEHMINEAKELSKLVRLRASKPQGFCVVDASEGEKVEKSQEEFLAYLDELKNKVRKLQMECPVQIIQDGLI